MTGIHPPLLILPINMEIRYKYMCALPETEFLEYVRIMVIRETRRQEDINTFIYYYYTSNHIFSKFVGGGHTKFDERVSTETRLCVRTNVHQPWRTNFTS